jgi:hypothetical protein
MRTFAGFLSPKLFIGAGALLSFIACRSEKSHNSPKPEAEAPAKSIPFLWENFRLASPEEKQTLFQNIQQQLLDFDECQKQGNCQNVDVKFENKPFEAKDLEKNPVIMVIDSGPSLSAVARYGSRVLNWYTLGEESGRLDEIEPAFQLPLQAKTILSDLLDKAPYLIAAQETQSFSKEFSKRFSKINDSEAGSHLKIVFNILAEYAPNARFVIVDLPPLAPFKRSELCRFDESDSIKARTSLANFNSDIATIGKNYGVDFINFSAGYTIQSVGAALRLYCEGPQSDEKIKKVTDLYTEMVKGMSSVEESVLVQANFASRWPLGKNDSNAPSDCISLENRIRVGYVETAHSQLGPFGVVPPTGGPFSRLAIPEVQNNAWECTDLYLNSGLSVDTLQDDRIPGETPLKYGAYGIDFRPLRFEMASSWAAPLATAHLVWIQQKAIQEGKGRLNRYELLKYATGNQPETNKVIDPLRNHQFIELK